MKLFGIFQFTKLDETQKILLDGMRENTKRFCSNSDAGFKELVGGQQTMEMAKLYSEVEKMKDKKMAPNITINESSKNDIFY